MPIHVRCQKPVAPVVFLPGDPDRARWIAANVLENAECTTSYRQMLGYTGEYEGMPVSVQTTGMGGPSAAIVCEELVELGAKFFIRIGTCGAMDSAMNPGDLLLVTASCMGDGTSKEIIRSKMMGSGIELGFPAVSDFEFLRAAVDEAERMGVPYHLGKAASLDRFYGNPMSAYDKMAELGICAVEMEAATVMTMAAVHHIRAAAMLTVSDLLDGQKRVDDETILRGVDHMIHVGLNAVAKLHI
ncbi:MAG: purine-nucleoside phosphorylase [Proteobacteria bacterium]|nr:purine-nucleoside phosphorylase [Pseudomonadota bacterium]